jgi:rhodanese-related sulfurtransferase
LAEALGRLQRVAVTEGQEIVRQGEMELEQNKSYVAYCKGGMRSAVAALLLSQHGYEAVSLSGGIAGWPHEVVKNY